MKSKHPRLGAHACRPKFAAGYTPEDESFLDKIPGGKLIRDTASQIQQAYQQGGVGSAIGAGVRGLVASPIATASDVLGNVVKPALDVPAQALKTAVTGDATPIGQEPTPGNAQAAAQPGASDAGTNKMISDFVDEQTKPPAPEQAPATAAPAPTQVVQLAKPTDQPKPQFESTEEANAYYRQQMQDADKAKAVQQLTNQILDNQPNASDTIGGLMQKRNVVGSAQSSLNALTAGDAARYGVDKTAATEKARVGILGKTAESEAALRDVQSEQARQAIESGKLLANLNNQYLKETDPAKRRVLADQINTLQGKPQQKYQIATNKGVAANGVSPQETSFIIDELGNAKPVEAAAATPAAPQDLQHFLQVAKAQPQNANLTDEQLTAYYNSKYGKPQGFAGGYVPGAEPYVPPRMTAAPGFQQLQQAGLTEKLPTIRMPVKVGVQPGMAAAQRAAKLATGAGTVARGLGAGLNGVSLMMYPRSVASDTEEQADFNRTQPMAEFNQPPGQLVQGGQPLQPIEPQLANGAILTNGPGSETSDSIPADLSKDEAVLPAKTVKAVGATNIAKLILATNGKMPQIGVRRNARRV